MLSVVSGVQIISLRHWHKSSRWAREDDLGAKAMGIETVEGLSQNTQPCIHCARRRSGDGTLPASQLINRRRTKIAKIEPADQFAENPQLAAVGVKRVMALSATA